MIKFTCEICGGNLLLDENGYASCPDCGAKYSKQTIDKIKKKKYVNLLETKQKVKLTIY